VPFLDLAATFSILLSAAQGQGAKQTNAEVSVSIPAPTTSANATNGSTEDEWYAVCLRQSGDGVRIRRSFTTPDAGQSTTVTLVVN
jgi:hypothetical protein